MTFREFDKWLAEEWPEPPTSVLGRLQHTLDVYDSPLLDSAPPRDNDLVIQATGGVYVDTEGLNTIKTGLTWGDLRRIRRYLEQGALR